MCSVVMLPVQRSALSRSWVQTVVVVALLVMHFTLAVGSKRVQSTTSDELVHLTGGFSYWQLHDYRLHPENGILPQRWAALPTYLQGATFPDLDQVYWRTSDVWVLGHEFFYETGEDHFPRLMTARAMIALFSVGTGLLVFFWSRALFGAGAAVLSLTFFAFSPIFLAHGALATSDVCMTFFFLASLSLWWRHLHDGRFAVAVLSAAVFGLACVAKFSAVLLLPMMALLAIARCAAPVPMAFGRRVYATPQAKLALMSGSALVHAVVAVFVIWAFYGFRYSDFNPALPAAHQFIRRWDLIEQAIGLQGKLVHVLAAWHALPEAFLYGYAYVIESAQSRSAFLNGEYSIVGWPSFFPWTFLLKTTLPVLIASLLVVAIVGRRWIRQAATFWPDVYRVLPLIVLFAVYWAFSLTTHLNIGQRHILPTYPVIFIAAGAILAAAWARRLAVVGIALGLGGWQIAEAARTAPYYLAYFNPIAGGQREAYRHLVDSSLDWGQDLPGLKTWLDTHTTRETPTFLSYFGTGEPDYYHIRARRLVMVNGFKISQPFVRLEAGVYCISTTSLMHVYSSVRGPWTVSREQAFQSLRVYEPAFADYEQHPERWREWEKQIPRADWERARERYEQLRFARLCHYLRARDPDAQIGYSINIYRLTPAEIAAAVEGNFEAWRKAVEGALAMRHRE